MTNTTTIPVAIVGLGRAGWSLHLKPILEVPGLKIVAVADPAAERTQEAADLTGCRQFSNIDDLLAETDAQLIVVATPSSTHYSDTLKALNSGRHCMTEKPMALSSKEADELVATARAKNLHLFVNHSWLHRDEIHHLMGIINSGILGPIFHVRTYWGHYSRRWDWQTLRKNGGGQLNNTCPHMLSMVLPLLGSPVKKVAADLRNIKDAGDAEDHVELLLTAENGTTANIVVTSAITPAGIPRWVIAGKYGTLISDGEKTKLRYYDPAQATPLEVLDTAAPGRAYLRETLPWVDEERAIEAAPVKALHVNAYETLIGAASPVVTPESAADVVRVTELAHRDAGY